MILSRISKARGGFYEKFRKTSLTFESNYTKQTKNEVRNGDGEELRASPLRGV